MIILTKNPGRLCNNLWSFAPFIALSLCKNETVVIQGFAEYYDLFENLNYLQNLKFGRKKTYNLTINTLIYLYRLLPGRLKKLLKIQTDKDFWSFFNKNDVSTAKYILFSSIDYQKANWRDFDYQHEIRHLFRPKSCYITKVTRIIEENRSQYDVLIGIHIRRGDYRNFMNGIYFYNDNVYYTYITSLEKELTGKRIGFLLCSDEAINLANYTGINYFQIQQTQPIEDLYALSLCDYIVGPPSTFSMWASFYGSVPLRVIKTVNESVRINQFSVIVSQDIFETGEHFHH